MYLYFFEGWNHANKCYYLLKSHPMSFFRVSGFKGFTPLAICEENQIFTLCCFFAVLFLVPFSVVCCCLRQAENFEEFLRKAMTGRLFSVIHWNMLRFAASKPARKNSRFLSLLSLYSMITITSWMFPKIGGFPPKSSILIGLSLIFTIHFGGKSPVVGKHPAISNLGGCAWPACQGFQCLQPWCQCWDAENLPCVYRLGGEKLPVLNAGEDGKQKSGKTTTWDVEYNSS